MTELTIKIEAPELSAAIRQLAESMKPRKAAENEIQNPKPTVPTPSAPIQAAPVPAPTSAPVIPATPIPAAMTAPAAQPAAPSLPTAAVVAQTRPAVTAAPASAPTAPAVPVSAPAPVAPTSAPQYTFDMLFNATAQLMNQNKGVQLQQLLTKYGVQRLPDLPREQYGAFATDLRALGVRI